MTLGKTGYCKLKEEALECTLCRTGYGPLRMGEYKLHKLRAQNSPCPSLYILHFPKVYPACNQPTPINRTKESCAANFKSLTVLALSL